MKNFISFFLLLLGITSLHASHIVAGNISYQDIGGGNYLITYREFTDCSSFSSPTALNMQITGVGTCTGSSNFLVNLISSQDITPICPGLTTVCAGGSLYGVNESVYQDTINAGSFACSTYRISYTNCCRKYTLTNGGAGSTYYVFSDILDFGLANGNSSPQFVAQPVVAVCTAQNTSFSQAAYDADGDSLVYAIGPSLEGYGMSIGYNVGYSPTSPLGANWNVSIEANTGQIHFNSIGTSSLGTFCVAIYISEYRNGQLIGTSMRDMQVIVENCVTAQNYNCCHVDYDYTQSGSTVNFSAITATGSTVSSYAWDFGDGGTSTLANPTHTYTNAGTYQATLVVNYASGCSDSATYFINVQTSFPSPVASFTYNVNANTVQFTNTTTGGTAPYNYTWSVTPNTSASINNPFAGNPIMTFTSSGTYTVCLSITDVNGMSDNTCQSIVINIPPTCDPLFSFTTNGMSADFTPTNFSSATVYTIDYGDGSPTASVGPVSAPPIFSHTYAANGVYTACMTATNGTCVQDTCFNVAINVGVDIDGYIYSAAAGGTPDSFIVYLIEYTNTGGGTLTKVDSQYINGNPAYYNFPNVNSTTMIFHTKAAMTQNSPNYATYIPTYYDNSLVWANSTPICIPCAPPLPATFDIYMQTGVNPGGPGFIGGLISLGANKTGDPAQKIEVMLWDMNDNPITYTYTDMSGNFGISNLAYGTYKVYPEVIGLVTEPYIVTIDGTNPSFNGVDMTMGDSLIAPTVVGVEMPSLPSAVLYPNPTADQFTFQAELAHSGMIHIEMYNAMGQKVYAFEEVANMGKYTHKMTVENRAAGVYTLKVSAENNGTQNMKIVVNR